MTSDKLNAQYLATLLKQYHCTDIVIAPGSRNAPLIISLASDSDYSCTSLPDERSAAFTAMGMALGAKRPVAVICSSGSAAVNFYPAVVEAYYQKLPLIIITADRPAEWIDQRIGQTIRQEGVFSNHICYEANLIGEPEKDEEKEHNIDQINIGLHFTKNGPVHINVPFDEPLYGKTEVAERVVQSDFEIEPLPDLNMVEYASIWNASNKIWLLAGLASPNPNLDKALNNLNLESPFLTFSETTSNLNSGFNVKSIDRLINTISDNEKNDLKPDLLITTGGEVVSKMVKKYLQKADSIEHWHISEDGDFPDTYRKLSKKIRARPTVFFESLVNFANSKPKDYRDYWVEKSIERGAQGIEYIKQASFSDLTAFSKILEFIPEDSILHTANSTSVRYTQLFDHHPSVEHYSNRGTSGIDGCTSTVIGHAMKTHKLVTLITGDLAFLYDSNAFWNDSLPQNLRVIILNNQGGNIFRIIEGPDGSQDFERYQETTHNLNLEGVARTFDIDYSKTDSLSGLREALQYLYVGDQRLKLLEVVTPRVDSPKILKDYFKYIKDGKY